MGAKSTLVNDVIWPAPKAYSDGQFTDGDAAKEMIRFDPVSTGIDFLKPSGIPIANIMMSIRYLLEWLAGGCGRD